MNCWTLLITKTVLVDCFGNRIRERNQDLDRQKKTVFLSPVINPSVTSQRYLFFFLLSCGGPSTYVRPCFWLLREKFTKNQISLLAPSSLSPLGHKRNHFNNHPSTSLTFSAIVYMGVFCYSCKEPCQSRAEQCSYSLWWHFHLFIEINPKERAPRNS